MGFDIDIEFNKEKIETFIDSIENAQGVAGYTAPYAIHLEYPTEYNNPSGDGEFLENLEGWVKRNLNVNNPRSVAYAIRNEIFKNGQEGDFFVTDTFNELKQGLAMSVAEEYEDSDDMRAPEKIVADILDTARDSSQDKIRDADRVDTGEFLNSDTVVIGVDPDSGEIQQSENLGDILD